MQGRVIGIDVGTTSVKAVMLDPSGRRLAEFAAPYPTRRPMPGQVEQDPEDWLRLVRACQRLAAEAERLQVDLLDCHAAVGDTPVQSQLPKSGYMRCVPGVEPPPQCRCCLSR